jgi:hypothetical protein
MRRTGRRRSSRCGALVAGAGIALAAEFTVVQRNQEFSVRDLEVRGRRPRDVRNGDNVTHNVYSETKGMEFEIELQPPGRSDTITLRAPAPWK